jgi:hypothetical protein
MKRNAGSKARSLVILLAIIFVAAGVTTSCKSAAPVVDTTPPTVIATSTTEETTAHDPIDVTITFDEAVTGFDMSDLVVANATPSNFTVVDEKTYTVDLGTLTFDTSVTLDIPAGACTDAAGNGNAALTPQFSRNYTDLPVPVITAPAISGAATNVSPIHIKISFAPKQVENFEVGDIDVTNCSLVDNFTETTPNQEWEADLTPTGEGDVTAEVKADKCNLLGSLTVPNDTSNTLSINYDLTAPTVAITSPSTSARTGAKPIPIVITFNEDVTDFDSSDLSVTNGSASSVTGGPAEYYCDITGAAAGEVKVDIAASAGKDLAGNWNTATATFSRDYITSPTLEATYSGTGTTGLTISNVTVGSSNNRLLLVVISSAKAQAGGPAGLNFVYWNTTETMTLLATYSGGANGRKHDTWIYYLKNPTSTTAGVTTSWNGSKLPEETRGVAYSLSDVLQSAPTGGTASSTTVTLPSWTIDITAAAANSLIFDIMSIHSEDIDSLTKGADQTERYKTLVHNATGASTQPTITAGALYSMTWTPTDSVTPAGGSFQAVEIKVVQ